MRRILAGGLLLSLVASSASARAHVCNVWLTPVSPDQSQQPDPAFCPGVAESVHVDAQGVVVASDTSSTYTAYGWATSGKAQSAPNTDGGPPTSVVALSDSHKVHDATLFTFFLRERAFVSIKVTPAARDAGMPWDPAFSLYRGIMPLQAHDDVSFDPLNPVSEDTFLPVSSPIDKAPGDPTIAQLIVVDAGTGEIGNNSAWTASVASQYASLYSPHNGYRDTLNYTTTGGLLPPGDPNAAYPVHPYDGQFDALGDWSMANSDIGAGETDPALIRQHWAKLIYLTHQNQNGPGLVESLANADLAAGEYTIAVDGANCALWESTECGLSGAFTGTVDFQAIPASVLTDGGAADGGDVQDGGPDAQDDAGGSTSADGGSDVVTGSPDGGSSCSLGARSQDARWMFGLATMGGLFWRRRRQARSVR